MKHLDFAISLTTEEIEMIMDGLNRCSVVYHELGCDKAMREYNDLWCQFYDLKNSCHD